MSETNETPTAETLPDDIASAGTTGITVPALPDHAWYLTKEHIRHIWKEVAQGRGRHGGFLRTFADAMCRADDANWMILDFASQHLIWKYGLEGYLDTFGKV